MRELSFSARCKTALHLGGAYRASSAAIAICRTCWAQLLYTQSKQVALTSRAAWLCPCTATPLPCTPCHANSFIPCPLRHCKAFAARYPYSSVSWSVALRAVCLLRSCILIKRLAKRHGCPDQSGTLFTHRSRARLAIKTPPARDLPLQRHANARAKEQAGSTHYTTVLPAQSPPPWLAPIGASATRQQMPSAIEQASADIAGLTKSMAVRLLGYALIY